MLVGLGEPAEHQQRARHADVGPLRDLLDNDDIYEISGTAIAFLSNLAALDRYADAARIERFLLETGFIGTPILRTVTAAAVELIAANADEAVVAQRELGRALDACSALVFMRQVLDELLDSSNGQPPVT